VLRAPVTAVQPGNTLTCGSAFQAFGVADLLDRGSASAVPNGCGQLQFEDISEKLAGLPSAEVRQPEVDGRAQGIRRESDSPGARSADPVYQGVMSAPWQR
jgi:hypothetical protein